MLLLSSTDLALARAIQTGTLTLVDREGRFGPYTALCDDAGVIEVHFTRDEVAARLAAVTEKKAKLA